MIRAFHNEPTNQYASRTTQQLFRRIDLPQTQVRSQSRMSKTSNGQRNFPHLDTTQSTKVIRLTGKSLDNSKESLMFQSFLQKVSSATRIDEKSIVANYLNNIRKDYDKMHKETKQYLSSINLKKKDIDFMKERVKLQHQSLKNLDDKMEDKLKQLQCIREKQQQVETQRKTLDHIIVRMKKDQIFYKQFGRIFQGHLNEKKKVLKAMNESLLSEDQKIYKLLLSIEDMKKQLEKNQQFREKKLEDYCEKLQNIQQKEMFIQERNQRTLELQAIESNDILKAKNHEMRNICLINKVADSLFESKMQRLINKYSHIQQAFHTIQVKTSINDPTLIANKFFSYGQLTENLMRSISNYEKILDEKTRRNQALKQELRKIQQRNCNNDSGEAKVEMTKKLTVEELNAINQKLLTYERIVDWIDRQAKKMKILENQNCQDLINVENIAKKFTQICLKAKSQTQQLSKNFKSHEKYVTPGIRIKKIVKENSVDYRSHKKKQTSAVEVFEQQPNDEDYLKVARARRNLMVKQKTINFGNLNNSKELKKEQTVSDRKLKMIESL